jgi:group I intron endonuclease
MKGYIYGLKCPIRNEIVYIGQTHNDLEVRLTKHISNTRSKIKRNKTFNKKDHWIKKLIRLDIQNKIEIVLIEECDLSIIDEREIYWIVEYRKFDFNKNIADGGKVNRGNKWSEESKKRMSENRKGKNVGPDNPNYGKSPSEEVKEKISISLKHFYSCHDANFKDKKHTEESLKKISENRKGKCSGENHPFFGKSRTEETRQKISEANSGENHPFFGKSRSEETRQKISEANSGEKNGMFGVTFSMSDSHKQNISQSLLKSEKFKLSRQSEEFKKKISDISSIPLIILDEKLNIIGEFKNCRECGEYLGYGKSNIDHAVKDLRQIGKGRDNKYWVVKKDKYEESIELIKIKRNI